MKTVFSIISTLILTTSAIASPVPATKPQGITIAKFTNEFSRFHAHRQANNIVLNWIFSDPNNVVSFAIEWSYDGVSFEKVDEVPAAGKNQYKHMNVFPGHNYYRIVALMYDGSMVYSNVEVVRIVRNG